MMSAMSPVASILQIGGNNIRAGNPGGGPDDVVNQLLYLVAILLQHITRVVYISAMDP